MLCVLTHVFKIANDETVVEDVVRDESHRLTAWTTRREDRGHIHANVHDARADHDILIVKSSSLVNIGHPATFRSQSAIVVNW